ncbi:MAG: ribose 5-phosphate isomerase B [Bacteroidales bacterium]|nr:ribose 5-phosphate isomerase B [Bacteroidales bacterium]
MAKIGMACDHAGYELKEYIKALLEERGNKVEDFGTFSAESMDYPDTAHPLAFAVEGGKVDFGVAMCGSGNGITMTLNKHQGVRAALCWDPEIASLAKRHNNANILSMPARFLTKEQAVRILDAYLDAEFEGGRHQKRIDKIPVPKQ